jgi:hypothetical protein
MGYKCDKVFVYPFEGEEPKEFVFIDLSKTTNYNRIEREGYVCVSFVVDGPKGLDRNAPIVLDDFTATSYPFTKYTKLIEISYDQVPPKLKRKFANWVKYQ